MTPSTPTAPRKTGKTVADLSHPSLQIPGRTGNIFRRSQRPSQSSCPLPKGPEHHWEDIRRPEASLWTPGRPSRGLPDVRLPQGPPKTQIALRTPWGKAREGPWQASGHRGDLPKVSHAFGLGLPRVCHGRCRKGLPSQTSDRACPLLMPLNPISGFPSRTPWSQQRRRAGWRELKRVSNLLRKKNGRPKVQVLDTRPHSTPTLWTPARQSRGPTIGEDRPRRPDPQPARRKTTTNRNDKLRPNQEPATGRPTIQATVLAESFSRTSVIN